MASIRKEILIEARPENVWAAVRDVGAVHQRLVPGVLVDARLDGDARVVTFASGAVARELLVDVDDEARRFAYAVVEGPLRATHHNASMQVFAEGSGRSRLVWITDVLPNDLAASISTLVEQGSAAMKQTLEKEAARG
jgi:carbon monoxide dehydrogenase subunit G